MPPSKKGSDNRDVLSGLPRSRPQRPSARREKARASAAKAKPAPAAAGPKAPAKPKSPAKAKPAARPKAAPKAKAPAAGYATPPPPKPAAEDHGLVSTALQAAGEIVQIGATVGSQALKSALRRIPRP